MVISKSNLFFQDKSYSQSKTLKFSQNTTEKKFFKETTRVKPTLLNIICALSMIASNKMIWKYSSFYYLAIGAILYGCSIYLKNSYMKKFIIAFSSVICSASMVKEGNICECIGISIPLIFINYFLLKNWLATAIIHIVQVSILFMNTNASKSALAIPIAIVNIFSYFLERDSRNLWILHSSYKKSDLIHQSMWKKSLSPVFLMDTSGNIEIYNNSAKDLIDKQQVQNKSKPNFDSIFPGHKDLCEKIIEKSINGKMVYKKFFKNPLRTDYNLEEVSYLIRSHKISWNYKNFVKITCINTSMFDSIILFIINCLKRTQNDTFNFFNYLAMICESDNILYPDGLTLFHKVQLNYNKIAALQNHFLFRAEKCNEIFDINLEVKNLLELLYHKACKFKVELGYTKERGVPNSVIGDKNLHNLILFCVLNLVFENSLENSESYLFVQVSVRFM